jgi:TolB-like protein/DNA-binding winged helix-turn-helix (wHTH) protein
MPAVSGVFVFENYRLDLGGGGLFRGNVPIALGSRALGILGLLVARRGELVTKEQIFAAVWPSMAIEESNLTVQIAALRRVLDDGRAAGSCIQTVSGRGYRFVAPVVREADFGSVQPHSATASVDNASIASQQNDGGQSRRPRDLTSPSPSPPIRHSRVVMVAASLIFVVAVIGGAWWARPKSSASPAFVRTAPAKPAARLSIVVLPFNNLSIDHEQQYFVDGVTEDLTTNLSRIAGSFVISRNTAFTYKGKSVDAKQIGRELGVRYVLEGSVQRSGKQVRVNAQLIDAETDGHLWAERFERDISDLFSLQNEVTGRLAIAFNRALVNAEAQRPTESPDVMDYIFRGRAEMLKPPSPDSYGKAIALFEHALVIDPHSVEAQSLLVRALMGCVLDQMSTSVAADIARAEGLVGQALATSPNSPLAHLAKAQVLRAQTQNLGMQNKCDEAILEYETVLASDPNELAALRGLANCKFFTGSIEEAVPLAERSMRLSPRDPNIWFPYWQIGRTRLLQSRIDEAIVWFEKARNAAPAHSGIRGFLAAAYGLKGDTELAAAELAEERRLFGGFSSIARAKTGPFGLPKIRAVSEATFFAGLRKAGVPEE